MSLTRKDYVMITEIVKTNYIASLDNERAKELAIELAHSFANDLALSNRAFDRNRFLVACGV